MSESMFDNVSKGDRVRVEIEAPANPFGDTQSATFDVTEIDGKVCYGVDPNWGDQVEVHGGIGQPHYAGGGKSGDVVSIQRMETQDGVTIHGSGDPIYRH